MKFVTKGEICENEIIATSRHKLDLSSIANKKDLELKFDNLGDVSSHLIEGLQREKKVESSQEHPIRQKETLINIKG